MTLPRFLWLLPCLFSATACFGDGDGDRIPIQPTLVAVSPSDFLGTVPCSTEPGGMQSYIATFYDVEDVEDAAVPGSGVALFSSPPVDCRRYVGTSSVVFGHRYVAEIVGFDRPPCDAGSEDDCVQPLIVGAPAAADRDGNLVEPRWTAICGRVTADPEANIFPGVEPAEFLTVYVRDCALSEPAAAP